MAGDFLDYMGNRFYGFLDIKDFCWFFFEDSEPFINVPLSHNRQRF